MDGDAKYLKRKVKAGSLDVHPTEKALGKPQTREYIDWQWPCTFWRTFHHDGVFMRVGGGVHALPFYSSTPLDSSCVW